MAQPNLPGPIGDAIDGVVGAGCDVPVLGRACDAAGAAGDLPNSVASSIGTGVLDQIAQAFAEGFTEVMTALTTFWVHTDTATLPDQGGPAAQLQADLSFWVGVAAIVGLLIAAGKLALGRSGQAAGEAALGLVRLVLVSALTIPVVAFGSQAGDRFSTWLLDRASGGDIEGQFTRIGALGATLLGVALTLILALLGMLAGVVQLMLMYARLGILIILSGVLPVTAALSGTQGGKAAFDRTLSWLIAFLLYKPVAAIVYAGALYAMKDGQQTADQIAGVFLIIAAVIALPALMRITAPVVSHVSSGTGGGLLLTGGALATGALPLISQLRSGNQQTPPTGETSGAASTGSGPGRPGPRGGPGAGSPLAGGGAGGGTAADGQHAASRAGAASAGSGGAAGGSAGAAGSSAGAGGAVGAAAAAGAAVVSRTGAAVRGGVRDVTGATGSAHPEEGQRG